MTQICKTEAKNKYFLTEKDIEHLDYQEKRNPHGKSSPMKLYDLDGITKVFCDKHGLDNSEQEIKSMLDELIQKKSNDKINKESRRKNILEKELVKNGLSKNNIIYINGSKITETMIEEIKRRELLVRKLSEKGLKLRSDSKICSEFIENGSLKIEEVVNCMCEMDWLFKNTNYAKIISKEIKNEIATARNEKWDYDIDDIRQNASLTAKKKAISEWLKNNINYNKTIPFSIQGIISDIKNSIQ